ncbi:uncharacterized protein LOC135195275 [Macrobrachium nipponense]|uniref:uncharacterized protein LOC135195275 n=1 Tax=Macrobrachium nipponense TaxID=159736 RepID=UPI0030C8CA53
MAEKRPSSPDPSLVDLPSPDEQGFQMVQKKRKKALKTIINVPGPSTPSQTSTPCKLLPPHCPSSSLKHETDVCLQKFKSKGHTVARCPTVTVSPWPWFRGCPVSWRRFWRIKGITPPPARPQDRQPPPRRPPSQPTRIDPTMGPTPTSSNPPQTPHPLTKKPPFASPTTSTPARVEAGTQTEQPEQPVEDMQVETITEAPALYAEAGTQTEEFPVKQDMEIQTCKPKLRSVASGSEFRFVGEQGIHKLLMTYDEFKIFIHRVLLNNHYYNDRLFTEIFQEALNFEISLPDDFLQSEFRFRTPRRQ